MSNAAVTLTNVNTNAARKATTNSQGNYRFAFITGHIQDRGERHRIPEPGDSAAISRTTGKRFDRLTINLGLRIEHYFNPSCNSSCFAHLATPFSGAAVDDSNTPYNQLILADQKHAYGSVQAIIREPRVGVAWKPFKHDDKTVIRTGFGIFADPVSGGLSDYAALNPPGNVSFIVGDGAIAPGVPGSLFTLASQSNQAFQSQFRSGGVLTRFPTLSRRSDRPALLHFRASSITPNITSGTSNCNARSARGRSYPQTIQECTVFASRFPMAE